uniref:Uncharacterized protein n=1 Tax=Rhizophora mucronata TaxID=61149 RepID=A0A2P2PZM5_RHIMU
MISIPFSLILSFVMSNCRWRTNLISDTISVFERPFFFHKSQGASTTFRMPTQSTMKELNKPTSHNCNKEPQMLCFHSLLYQRHKMYSQILYLVA